MAVKRAIKRYQANFRAEEEGSLLYQEIANTVQDANLVELYRRLSETEQRHASIWAKPLQAAGQPVPTYTLDLRMRLLVWMAKRFGVSSVLPMISRRERGASRDYEAQPEARAAALPADERSHARIFRAAVLGASDDLTTNLSLVMGVAGANLPGHTILFTGLAGMLAGALSMGIGEWLSVQSARELYTHQIEVERQELADIPQEEEDELALIYQAKGVDPNAAKQMAARIIAADKQDGEYEAALDTIAREELVIDPKELGGSPWEAAITSFMLFAAGAAIPVIPFAFGSGWMAVLASVFLGILGLFIVGIGITLITGAPLLKSGVRQVLLGLVAASITFGLGWLVGGRLA